jgi:hypothetical protein
MGVVIQVTPFTTEYVQNVELLKSPISLANMSRMGVVKK